MSENNDSLVRQPNEEYDFQNTSFPAGSEVICRDVYCYKGPCNSWRYGPELNEPKCWLHSDCTGTIEDFDMASAKCKGGVQWHEYENGKWEKLWTVRMYKPTWATPDHPSAQTSSQISDAKEGQINGFYDRTTDENGNVYYHRTACSRADQEPHWYWPGEEPTRTPTPTPPPTPVRVPSPVIVAVEPSSSSESEPEIDIASEAESVQADIEMSDTPVVYLYKLNDKWRLGPDYEDSSSWLFTKDGHRDGTWYKGVKSENEEGKTHRVRKTTGFTVKTLDEEDNVLYATPEESEAVTFPLNKSARDNLLGSYKKVPSLKDVWVHGPINHEDEPKKLPVDEMPDMGTLYVTKGHFISKFKEDSLTGHYDKISAYRPGSAYLRRELSTPDRQYVYCSKVEGRWLIAPEPFSRKCWAYSAVTDKQPSNVGIWYENLENEYNDGKYLNNQPVEDGFRRNEMRVL